ncbi:MAG: hypothetical protein HY293_18995, partial [Planctomycetes bacterium]|nr:hypothetical protein [Planctomycetota bacterium]
MASGNGVWGALKGALGGRDKATLQRWLFVWLILVAAGWFWLIPTYVTAQDKKEEAKPTAAPEMAKPAEAPKPAEQAPAARNDPNGGKTGDVTILSEVNVADPGAAPDPKVITDPKAYNDAKKEYDEKKKAFDEFTELNKKEPLASKL